MGMVTGPAPFTRTDWVIQGGAGASNYRYVDSAGRPLSLEQAQALCGRVTDLSSKDRWGSCLQAHRIGELIRYQPASRFWEMQAFEATLIVTIAVALLGLTAWWLRNRSY